MLPWRCSFASRNVKAIVIANVQETFVKEEVVWWVAFFRWLSFQACHTSSLCSPFEEALQLECSFLNTTALKHRAWFAHFLPVLEYLHIHSESFIHPLILKTQKDFQIYKVFLTQHFIFNLKERHKLCNTTTLKIEWVPVKYIGIFIAFK